jgi:hypothetical protein
MMAHSGLTIGKRSQLTTISGALKSGLKDQMLGETLFQAHARLKGGFVGALLALGIKLISRVVVSVLKQNTSE